MTIPVDKSCETLANGLQRESVAAPTIRPFIMDHRMFRFGRACTKSIKIRCCFSPCKSAQSAQSQACTIKHIQNQKKHIRWYPQQLKTPLAYAVGEISRTKKSTYPLRCISITLFTSSRFYSLTLKAMKIWHTKHKQKTSLSC